MAKRSLNELEAAVMVIIVGNHKERLKLAAKAIDDNLIDPGKVLMGKGGRKSGNGLNEVVGAKT